MYSVIFIVVGFLIMFIGTSMLSNSKPRLNYFSVERAKLENRGMMTLLAGFIVLLTSVTSFWW